MLFGLLAQIPAFFRSEGMLFLSTSHALARRLRAGPLDPTVSQPVENSPVENLSRGKIENSL
jgi:hypothetical protein